MGKNNVKCDQCDGTGLASTNTICEACNGSGVAPVANDAQFDDAPQTAFDGGVPVQGVESEFNEVPEGGNPTGGKTQFANSVINWQDGIIVDGLKNGAFVEDVITAAIQRLEYFQDSKFECQENADAIASLQMALAALESRTKTRVAQGVENTYETHTDATDDNPPAADDVETKQYRVLENALGGGVEYPQGTVHEPGSILTLTDVEAEAFAPGLIEPVETEPTDDGGDPPESDV